jgi:heptosyltransferase-2
LKFLIQSGIGIGDTIQLLSMAKYIKRTYPSSQIDLIFAGNSLSYEINSQIIQLQNYVDHLFWYSKKKPLHNLKLFYQLKWAKYDVGFLRLENTTGKISPWIYYIMKWINCKNIVGTNCDKVDIKVNIPDYTHYLERNALMIKAIGINAGTSAKCININKLDHKWFHELKIDKKLPIIAISMGTNSVIWKENNVYQSYDVKSWDYFKWIKLSEKLLTDGYIVFLIGGEKEKRELEQRGLAVPKIGNTIYNFIGETTIKQSLTLLFYSTLAVGSEGGMMHCASSVGVRTLTIFGGSDYRCFNPGGSKADIINLNLDCSPCFLTPKMAQCIKHKCLENITVSMVEEKIKKILNDC